MGRTQRQGDGGHGYWQCRSCSGIEIRDRLLGVVGEQVEVHRLICETCGAVSHYDRTGTSQPTKSLNNQFWWIE